MRFQHIACFAILVSSNVTTIVTEMFISMQSNETIALFHKMFNLAETVDMRCCKLGLTLGSRYEISRPYYRNKID